MVGADTGVIGRERELGVLQAFMTAPTEPAALVLEGGAGIGKTTLWRAGVEFALASGYVVLRCRPAAAESQLSFAAVADLLADVLDEALPSLPAPQRRALEVALMLKHADGATPGVRAIAGGFLGVVRHAAATAPVLVAIDDAQWIDEPSRGVLEFVLRRLRDECVRLLVSRRGSGEALPLGLGTALPPGRAERLPLTRLSVGAVHRLLHERLGVALSRPMLRRLHVESGGNPFYALELAQALERRGSTLRPDQPLPVPHVLQQLVHERISALPADVIRLLELVAALFDRRVSDVSRLATEYGLTGAIDEAIAADVLALDGQRLEFTHPLLATGVYAGIGPERRHALHRRLAELGGRDEARALHLALAAEEPNAAVAAELERSSLRARARGATDTAGRLAESAARLTPPEDAEAGARRLIAAADHFLVAGDPAHGRELLRGVVEWLPAGPVRAEALSLLSWAAPEKADLALAAQLGEQALSEAGGDLALEATIRLRLAVIEEIRGHLDASAEHRRIAVELAEEGGEPALLATALSAMGYVETLRGARVARESRRAVEIERSLPEFLGQYTPSISLGQVLMYTDRLDQARTVLREVLERATVAGHEDARATCLFHLADLERRAGNWEAALMLSDETRELNSQAGNEQEYASCLVVGALLDAGMGRVEQAREDARLGLAAAERMGDETFAVHYRGVLGFVELSLGDVQAAQQWLAPATDSLVRQAVAELSVYPVVQNEIDAAVEAGDLDRVEHLVAHLERLADETRRAWTRAIACRGRGSLQAAVGDLDGARTSLEAALDAHASVPQPFEHARSLLVLGRIERRAKRKRPSRETLEQAAAIFAALPAPLWTAKVDGEIARLGLRSAPAGLTETEARIAELAAAGMTNPEIAAAAFVSRKTVEANLSKVYRKLGVRSRVELARRLPAPDEVQGEA